MEYRLSQNLVVIQEPLVKANVEKLREVLTKTLEPPESLIIDLTKSHLIDTAGVQLLIAMREFMLSNDRQLTIHFNEDLEKILNLCGLSWLVKENKG
jgi:anti-anti-sigma regulatory factor